MFRSGTRYKGSVDHSGKSPLLSVWQLYTPGLDKNQVSDCSFLTFQFHSFSHSHILSFVHTFIHYTSDKIFGLQVCQFVRNISQKNYNYNPGVGFLNPDLDHNDVQQLRYIESVVFARWLHCSWQRFEMLIASNVHFPRLQCILSHAVYTVHVWTFCVWFASISA